MKNTVTEVDGETSGQCDEEPKGQDTYTATSLPSYEEKCAHIKSDRSMEGCTCVLSDITGVDGEPSGIEV